MEDAKRKELEEKSLKDISVTDAIEYFGNENILNQMNDYDISDYIEYNSHILNLLTDDTLLDAITDVDLLCSLIDNSEMIDELTSRGYCVKWVGNYNTIDQEIMHDIEELCREIQPSGYIGKEEAKKILSDYIDKEWSQGGI